MVVNGGHLPTSKFRPRYGEQLLPTRTVGRSYAGLVLTELQDLHLENADRTLNLAVDFHDEGRPTLGAYGRLPVPIIYACINDHMRIAKLKSPSYGCQDHSQLIDLHTAQSRAGSAGSFNSSVAVLLHYYASRRRHRTAHAFRRQGTDERADS